MNRKVKLNKEWVLTGRMGGGGFGQVFHASSPGEPASVAKLVPKDPGAERELLFIDLADVRNVVPVVDSGETEDSWVLVMPLADMSLRDHMRKVGGALGVEDALTVLSQVLSALVDLSAKGIVHRDLKPENILLLNGTWCLADFGISRYAEATTAPDTQKFALSPIYAAPERWRLQRATPAADVYALGVVAYELLSGAKPFPGPKHEDLREQHLHGQPAPIANIGTAVDGLITECLHKSPEARPTPANALARVEQIRHKPPAAGLSRLREVHRSEVARRSEIGRIRVWVFAQVIELARAYLRFSLAPAAHWK
jgi:eukaryotic-like serine/threonine-protein kinase